MTEKELIDNGYEKYEAKIGTLYFKGGFFGRITEDGKVDYRSNKNDMRSLGLAETFDDINRIEVKWYKDQIRKREAEIELLKAIVDSYELKDDEQ